MIHAPTRPVVVLRPLSTCSSWSWSDRSTAPRPKRRRSTSSRGSRWTTVRSWRPCRSTHNAPLTSSSGPCRRSAKTLYLIYTFICVFTGAARENGEITSVYIRLSHLHQQFMFHEHPVTVNDECCHLVAKACSQHDLDRKCRHSGGERMLFRFVG